MNVKQFVKQHREDWKRLEEMVTILQKKKNTSGDAIRRFNKLYQKAARISLTARPTIQKKMSLNT